MVLDNEEEQQFNMPLERFTFTYWLDLDSYFREWLVHQSFISEGGDGPQGGQEGAADGLEGQDGGAG